DGKGPPAAPAEEALDEAAVTLAAVAAVEAVLEVTVRTCRAIGMGAACGSKTHGVLLPGARLGPGQRDGLGNSWRVAPLLRIQVQQTRGPDSRWSRVELRPSHDRRLGAGLPALSRPQTRWVLGEVWRRGQL